MLDSIYIVLLLITVVFQLVAIFEKSIVFSVLSIMMWMVLIINSLFIEWPYYSQVYNISSSSISTTEGTIIFSETGLSALFLMFVFFDIVWAILQYMDWKHKSKLP